MYLDVTIPRLVVIQPKILSPKNYQLPLLHVLRDVHLTSITLICWRHGV